MEHIKYKLTIDPTPVTTKPSQEERNKIRSRLIEVANVTIVEFGELVSPPNSLTWSGGIFNGTSSNENWRSQSIFGLDFDNGDISVDDVYSKFNEYGITPQLWYHSFSSLPEHIKFRVVLFVDTPITNRNLHQLMSKGLLKLFPEADQSCSDAARYFFGGQDSTITSHIPIPCNDLIDMASIVLCSNDSMRTRSIPVTDVNSFYKSLAPKWALLYNTYSKYHSGASITSSNISLPPTTIKGGELERIDFNIAKQNIRVFNEFTKGTRLTHMMLFGLASNLTYVNGGLKLLKQTMNKYNNLRTTNYSQNNFAILTYLKKVKYPPQPIYQFSPYEEDSELHDFISESKDKRGHIKVLEPINRISLEVAEQKFKDEFNRVINEVQIGKIHLFKVPTAMGKTELTTNVHATIAVPTNDLKNEIGGRMKVDFVTTPDPIEFENSTLNNQLQYYYSLGLPKKSNQILHSVVSQKNKNMYSPKDISTATEYLNKLNESYTTTSTLLTTHERVMHSDFKNDTLIFDEDPNKTLINIKQLKISDLFKINQHIKSEELGGVIKKLSGTFPLEIIKTPLFKIDLDEIVKSVSNYTNKEIDSNILDFFTSNYIVKSQQDPNIIHYVIKRDFPRLKKVIILSATAPVEIYRMLYGDRLEVIDISDVEQQGKIIQHTSKSYSRNSLNRNHKEIVNQVMDTPIITFKSFKDHFNNPSEMWFGNCSGYDTLKGQDIAVVGTPHLDNVVYLLTAKVMGLDLKTSDTSFCVQKVQYNGFEFIFNCYLNDDLRKIQFSYIESDLIQAVGRARTLRTNATVDLYSNFPLRISNEFMF